MKGVINVVIVLRGVLQLLEVGIVRSVRLVFFFNGFKQQGKHTKLTQTKHSLDTTLMPPLPSALIAPPVHSPPIPVPPPAQTARPERPPPTTPPPALTAPPESTPLHPPRLVKRVCKERIQMKEVINAVIVLRVVMHQLDRLIVRTVR